MQTNIKNKIFEMPLQDFVKIYPGIKKDIAFSNFDFNDCNYIARFVLYPNFKVEVGYKNDNWLLK